MMIYMENKNNKAQEINNFLYQAAKVGMDYPEVEITKEFIYANLIKINVPKKEKYIVKENFPKWVDYFKSIPNINVIVDPTWPYFCQFINNFEEVAKKECIKLYVPISSERIYECANKIFSLLAKENISHASKISSDVRNDDIVIRVTKKSDAKKIIEYINQDARVRKHLLKTNPFCITIGGVGIASDNKLSYNSETSKYIAEYITTLKKNNDLKQEDYYTDFLKYLIYQYNTKYIEGKGLSSNDIGLLINEMQILDLLINSIKDNANIKDFTRHWENINLKDQRELLEKHYRNKLKEKVHKI